MAVIVRPCFPITFPMSSFATRSSMMSEYSPSIPCTRTWSGLSTIAFAMCSTSSMMAVGSPPVVTPGSPLQPCAPAGHETTRLSGGSVAPPGPPGTSSGGTRTSAESRREPTGQRRQAGRAESPCRGRHVKRVKPGACMRTQGGRHASRHGTCRVATRNSRDVHAPRLSPPRHGRRVRLRTVSLTKYI